MNATLPMPLDVRLMNFTATVLFVGLLALAAVFGTRWVLRQPFAAITGISVQGDLVHNNEVTLRANVGPQLAGNFFTADLAQARAAFEAVPWVRKALVKRDFPGRLKVVLEEHQPAALWGGERDPKLVNTFGEVFEANLGEVDTDDLPRLVGPVSQARAMLAMERALGPELQRIDARLAELTLSGRGGWHAELDSGADIELGSGTVDDVLPRLRKFLATLPAVTAQYGRRTDAVLTADLRHSNGYALRMRGVTTVAADAPGKKK